MAFNPLKNKNTNAPEIKEETVENTNVNTPIEEEVSHEVSYEGTPLSDLQETAVDTLSGIGDFNTDGENTKETPSNQKKTFNIPYLDNLPLDKYLIACGATVNENSVGTKSYLINGQEISIKENKWYNKTQNRGRIKLISLVTHLLALEQNIDETIVENRKKLFYKACTNITTISASSEFNQEITDSKEIIKEVKTKEEEKQEQESKYARIKLINEQLNNISLVSVLEYIGATPNEDNQKGKWKIHDSGDNVGITGQQWYSWKENEGGIGAISFTMFYLASTNNWNLKDEESRKSARRAAISYLKEAFGIEDLSKYSSNDLANIVFKEPFAMPHAIDEKIDVVKSYLHEKRSLPLWVINKQIKGGFLFAGFPSDWKQPKELRSPELLSNDQVWATFLSSNGTAAEMRAVQLPSSNPLSKLLAKGSDKELGGFVLKAEKEFNEKTLTALEASIDSMSYHAIYPGRIATSCMGVNFNLAIKLAKQAFERDYVFELGFDNDLAGNEAAVRFRINLIESLGKDAWEEYLDEIGEESIKEIKIKDQTELDSLKTENTERILNEKMKEEASIAWNNTGMTEPLHIFEETFKKQYATNQIEKLGLELYNEYARNNKIRYFDLGLRCLEESINTDKIFYFDVSDNEIGLEAVKLFQGQAHKRFGKEYVQNAIKNNKLKYINVWPDLAKAFDLEKEAAQVIEKIESGKPYYIRLKDLNEEDNSKSQEKINLFLEEFYSQAGDRIELWKEKGLLIESKEAIAKDWNEYLIYCKENKPTFNNEINALEEKFAHYAVMEEKKKGRKKGKKP